MSSPPEQQPGRGSAVRLIGTMLTPPVAVQAVKVSLFVGSCLNAINQGPAIWRGEPVIWSKFALNFLVPFLVSAYSAAKVRRAQED